ncbi:MAG: glycosyltransferase, partial [Acidobacteria bacterium]|nr:glycosyltransferase [Acidobacteriota bacterium]
AHELPEIDFHISDGNRASGRRESDGNIHRLGYVSYARDLLRYALVIHHGGSGVLAHALAAGTPSLVVPADYDQFDNAARLEVAGVGARVRRPGELSGLITRALADSGMRARCRAMQALLQASRAEDRVAARVCDALRLY